MPISTRSDGREPSRRQRGWRAKAAGWYGRHRLLSWSVGAPLAVVVLLGGYGTAIEPRLILDVDRQEAPIPGLPESWEGRRVGLIADLQIGLWWDNVGMARRAVARLVEEQPAAALLAGDFVYGGDDVDDNVTTAVDVVAPLPAAGIPTYAVLGNHDYTAGAAEQLRARLTEAGITVLHNEAIALPSGAADGGRALHLAGVGPPLPGEARPRAALRQLPPRAPRIVLIHNPASFAELPPNSAPLAVAGHTHGGQIRVPFAPNWSYLSLVEPGPVHVDGWIEDFGAQGNRLYVNRGIGMSHLPLRINCPPQLTVLTLHRPKTP